MAFPYTQGRSYELSYPSYSSYSVLVKIAVPRAKICTPGVRYSSYSVLPVLGAENNDRTPC